MSRTHIIIFSTAYHPFLGGAEIAISEIAKRLPELEFHIITARFQRHLAKTEKIGNVTVHRLGFGVAFDKYLLPVLGYMKGKQLISTFRGKVVLWGVMIQYATIAGFLLSRIKNLPLLITLQEGDRIEGRKMGLVSLSWKMIIPKATHVQAISEYLKNLAKLHGYKSEVSVIPNGVDIRLYGSIDKEQIEKIKQQYQLGKFSFVLISVSRLVEKNCLKDIIAALPELPNGCLMLVGSGSEETKLRAQSVRIGVSDRVIFVGDVPNAEVPAYLWASDVFVRPSASEGLGTAFLEAMAAGLPIIATSVGGIRDFLIDRETGIVLPVNDPLAIATAVKLLLSDHALMEKIQGNSKRLIATKYSWDIIASDMERIFHSL